MVVVDEDAGVIRQLIAQGLLVHGDGSDVRHEACALFGGEGCSFNAADSDAQLALNYLKDSPVEVIVRVFEKFEEDMVRCGRTTHEQPLLQLLNWEWTKRICQVEKPSGLRIPIPRTNLNECN